MISTMIYHKQPIRFNMAGQSLPRNVVETNDCISDTLSKSLVRYATGRLYDYGFEFAERWNIEVYTMDDDEPNQYDRTYCVKWMNEKGGYIELVGIFINKRTPDLDHGMTVGQD